MSCKPSDVMDVIRFAILAVLAISAATYGFILSIAEKKAVNGLDPLYCFAVAGLILLLERVRELSIGPTGLKAKLDQLRNEMDEKNKKLERAVVEGGGRSRTSNESAGDQAPEPTGVDASTINAVTRASETRTGAVPTRGPSLYVLRPVSHTEDPQKGRFGGESTRANRRLTAERDRELDTELFYGVVLEVRSTDPTNHPLSGTVKFYLHDSFAQPVRTVKVKDGVARLEVPSFGAFTVGALTDELSNPLELDLEFEKQFPKAFREA